MEPIPPCPSCGAAEGEPCVTKAGNEATVMHAARAELLSEPEVTPEPEPEADPDPIMDAVRAEFDVTGDPADRVMLASLWNRVARRLRRDSGVHVTMPALADAMRAAGVKVTGRVAVGVRDALSR
jgi:hypothetical protein